jgi:hypothetical protein
MRQARLKALRQITFVLVVIAAALTTWAKEPAAVHSQWVYLDRSSKLVYQRLKMGDRILDFSYAGYMGGGVAFAEFSREENRQCLR